MNLEEAKADVGKMVMSRDPKGKLIARVFDPHGPYRLLRVTKGGMCVLDRDPNKYATDMVKPSLLSVAKDPDDRA